MNDNRSAIVLVCSFVAILVLSIGIMVVSYDIKINPAAIDVAVEQVPGLSPAQGQALRATIHGEIDRHTAQDLFYRQVGSIVILFYAATVYLLYYDIKLRKRIAMQQNLQYRIADVLSEHSELRDAASNLLKAIAETTESQVGAVWLVDSQNNKLKFVDMWRANSFSGKEFIAATKAMSFPQGEGVPGRVWSSTRAEWIEDLGTDKNVQRDQVALKEGLKSAFAFPIRMGSNVVGAMEFFSAKRRSADHDLLRLCDGIGFQIGQFIAREHVQVMKDENERRLRTLTEAIPHIVWTADESGQIDFFNSRLVEYTGLNAEQTMDEAWKLLIHPEDRRKYLEEWRHAIATGDTFELEFRLRRVAGLPNSEYRWQLGRAVAMRDPDGAISEWFGTWTDIDDQKAVHK